MFRQGINSGTQEVKPWCRIVQPVLSAELLVKENLKKIELIIAPNEKPPRQKTTAVSSNIFGEVDFYINSSSATEWREQPGYGKELPGYGMSSADILFFHELRL